MKTWLRDQAAARNMLLVRYDSPDRARRMARISAVMKELDGTLLLNHAEAAQIISCVEATETLPGDLAEVGVYRGGSAKLIAEFSTRRQLHLFDTFQGLPDPISAVDAPKFHARQFADTSIAAVSAFIGENPRVHYYKGLFPDSAHAVADTEFSFVHLDVDLYEATLASLHWFWPRMNTGGMILTHDYVTAQGVNQACREFSSAYAVPVLELTGYQGLLVKTG